MGGICLMKPASVGLSLQAFVFLLCFFFWLCFFKRQAAGKKVRRSTEYRWLPCTAEELWSHMNGFGAASREQGTYYIPR